MKYTLVAGMLSAALNVNAAGLRPPAVPLVACDPYFSVWSAADQPTDTNTTHWTGKPHRLTALARIDGKTYRVLGADPQGTPPMKQTALTVLPTRTQYKMEAGGVAVELTFTTPALPDELDLLARPVTYVNFAFCSQDNASHDVALYFDASAELAVNVGDQEVDGAYEDHDGFSAIRIGSVEQEVLGKRGDDLRIDWGYLYLAVPSPFSPVGRLGRRAELQDGFAQGGANGVADAGSASLPAAAADIAGAVVMPVGEVGKAPVERRLILAYDDLYSIQYMKKNLRPYWRRDGWEAADLLAASVREYEGIAKRCADLDADLMADLTRAGGEKYAAICALAYRQCFAAGKFVADANGQPLQFCKENHSNGCIATSDVFYPMSPQFLLFGTTLVKSFIVPFMNYAASDRWRFPFAPHDLGTYPHANGQRYGGREDSEENQMPVEESGNLLLLMCAIAKMEGNADFASLYWPRLTQWAAYLKTAGFDPENQLCTDDFAGHLAHNVNLSVKAICAQGAYGQLCAMRGEEAAAAEYTAMAKDLAQRWASAANDGDHFRLAFDKSGTWSQKYNLVWDRILGLGLFSPEIAEKEMAYYRELQNRYGLPLDNRSLYTKLDWVLWTATLTQDRDDFEALVNPVFDFLNMTPDRVPMTDFYFTDSGKRSGFTARPVVGGVFLQALYDEALWTKYAGRDMTTAAGWAPMPVQPRSVTLVPTGLREEIMWRYTTEAPGENWFAADFDDSGWKTGPAGFGTQGTPGAVVRTEWNTQRIWIRRDFELAELPEGAIALRIHHDEDAEVYLNGVRALKASGYTTDYEVEEIDPKHLRAGTNTLAICCRQTEGGQYIDVGIDRIIPAAPADDQ